MLLKTKLQLSLIYLQLWGALNKKRFSVAFLFGLHIVAVHAQGQVEIYCLPNEEAIIRISDQSSKYIYQYKENGFSKTETASFTVEQRGRILRFQGPALSNMGAAFRPDNRRTITFSVNPKYAFTVIRSEFSRRNCKFYPY